GRAARLNQLVSSAGGTIVARMDADDISYPQRLERQLRLLNAQPGVDVVGSSMIVFRNHGELAGKRPAPGDHADICRRPGVGFALFHPTWMGRVQWFRRYPYRLAAVRCEDMDLLG